ncbi:MAG: hypothetical protein EOP04_23700 [Proteobacteria bacterium]|nr:MAG: hypothetical protein EOP04_23700 [Pseudomonadota bacterium]
MADMLHPLKPDEIELARQIWHSLTSGAPDAHARLKVTSENVREAILLELVEASDKGKTPSKPFG